MINYEIKYSKRKTIAIYITPDAQVEVRCPFRTSRTVIDRFVRQKEKWINKKLSELQNRENTELRDGSKVLYLGEEYPIIISDGAEGFMDLHPAKVGITSASTRWGSCSAKNSINFTWKLIMADMSAIDYVIVHELAHIKEKITVRGSGPWWAVIIPIIRKRGQGSVDWRSEYAPRAGRNNFPALLYAVICSFLNNRTKTTTAATARITSAVSCA